VRRSVLNLKLGVRSRGPVQVMEEGEEVTGASAALAAFDGLRNMITLSFNNPALPSPDGVTEYNLTLPTSLRSTLEAVKADIAKCVDPHSPHVLPLTPRSIPRSLPPSPANPLLLPTPPHPLLPLPTPFPCFFTLGALLALVQAVACAGPLFDRVASSRTCWVAPAEALFYALVAPLPP
jgi:hypothetical protein